MAPTPGSQWTPRWRKKDSNLRSPKRRVLRARDALRSCQGCGTREDPWNGQPLAFLAALRIRSSAFIDTHLSRRRSRAFRPKAPFHVGRRRCRHSTTSVEAELWITDQYFGAAKKRDSAIDARGYRVGSGKLRGDIISHAVFRVVKPAVRSISAGLRALPWSRKLRNNHRPRKEKCFHCRAARKTKGKLPCSAVTTCWFSKAKDVR